MEKLDELKIISYIKCRATLKNHDFFIKRIDKLIVLKKQGFDLSDVIYIMESLMEKISNEKESD